ncbi:MAG TPA: condensation domain-containing protein, partial [Tahibacter sp.]|nr:condensation domain-containing protein [Tahibacter sp.]
LDERVTVLNQTPTAFRQLIDVDRASAPAAFALRYVVFGGEALELQSLRPWMDRHGEERPRLINMYGITETTVHVTYRPIARADIDAGAGSVIGVPIPDLRVYVLDADGRIAAVGVPGEMYVAGAGVAAGYLNRPELSAQRFLPDPFASSGDGAARMYRSGDLARRLESGELEYLGRIDQQVKIRGFRIELGEIEAVIAHNPRVRQIAVIDREDVPGEKRLVAYLVAETAQEPLLAELREVLRQRLPDYMTPAQFVFVDALPLTPNGKLDRKALPAPDQARAASTKAYAAPRDATEAALADAWKEVLRVERVGIDDHFFELGGDSILSIQVIARCHQRGLRVTPRDLFKHPTIAELAKVVTASTPARATMEDLASGAVPLTPIQKWFFEQRFDDAHWWNQAFLFTVAPDFDVDAFDRALAAVVAHHDALRLRYSENDGAWTQQYGPAPVVRAERVDFSPLPEAARAEAMTAHATRVQGSLDPASGPMIRATCFALGRDVPGRVLLVVHHLVVDGVSWRLLREDLETAYLAAKAGKAPSLPPKTTSMRTWAERSDAFARTTEVENALPHWLAVAKTPPTVLPADADAGAASDLRRFTVALGEDETRAVLQALPKAFRTRINDVLLGGLARALQRVAASETFRIDLEGHGREHIADDVDVSRTVGWFTTLFPIALDVPSGGDAAEAALAVRDRLREVPHRGMSHGLLRYAARDDAARDALAAGASFINDVSGFRLDPAMARVASESGAGVVLMHSRGDVADMAT